jgi:hypothetical protein
MNALTGFGESMWQLILFRSSGFSSRVNVRHRVTRTLLRGCTNHSALGSPPPSPAGTFVYKRVTGRYGICVQRFR